MNVILTVLAVCAVLVASEYGYRRSWFRDNEVARKFVHISVGSFVALWPFFLTWNQIRLLSISFVVGVAISHKLRIFHAIHSVQRPTYGEVYFAATVGLLTYITHSKGVYAAALLQMSLADGFAAVFGSKWGRGNTYHLFGHAKSVVGTSVFIITSVALFIGYNILGNHNLAASHIAFGALVAALFENVAPWGLDNLAVPLFIGWLLTIW
jgi:dolichol kinase